MKTNHRRGFKAATHRNKGGAAFHRVSLLAESAFGAHADFDFSNGNRGMAKSVRGAKKFVNSRFRFHENAAARKLSAESDQT